MTSENDPLWAAELGLPEAKVWEKRANEQLARARAAEKHLEIAQKKLLKIREIHGVGATPLEALQSLAAANDWGDIVEGSLSDLEYNPNDFDWAHRFKAGEGTGFKAAGNSVPGGCTVTWWK